LKRLLRSLRPVPYRENQQETGLLLLDRRGKACAYTGRR